MISFILLEAKSVRYVSCVNLYDDDSCNYSNASGGF